MSVRCNMGIHRWGIWDWWFPLGRTQARHCLRCKKIQVRDLASNPGGEGDDA